MPAKHLCKAIDNRMYISKKEAKAKAINKKAISQKKRLLKVHKVLKRAYKEVDHYCLKCAGYILEKTTFK